MPAYWNRQAWIRWQKNYFQSLAKMLLVILTHMKSLKGDMKGLYSRRINKQHRIVYDVLPNDDMLKDDLGELYKGIVKIIRMWTHYE